MTNENLPKTISKATSIDIAFRAGVSQSTVSRALSGSSLVNAETREKVQKIARELNYKVDKNASNLRTKSTRTIALLLFEDPTSDDSDINPFFLSLLGSITHATAQRGFDLLVSFQQDSNDWFADYEEAKRADGLILLGYGDYQKARSKLDSLSRSGAHFVLWGPVSDLKSGAAIGCDNMLGAYIAAKHLISLGRTNLAFIGDITESEPEFHERFLGFKKALDEANVTHISQVGGCSTEIEGIKAAEQLLIKNPNVDGIFCASDLLAVGVIKALSKKSKQVPRDVSVIGYDDISMAAYMSPALTTIRQNTREAGRLLVDTLLDIINGEEACSQLLEPDLIIRESCGAAQPPE